jgi:hypothetical protein
LVWTAPLESLRFEVFLHQKIDGIEIVFDGVESNIDRLVKHKLLSSMFHSRVNESVHVLGQLQSLAVDGAQVAWQHVIFCHDLPLRRIQIIEYRTLEPL